MKAIELAIKTETDAIAFYKQAAEKTSHPVGKKMFLSIMEDEQRHLDDFKCILAGLKIKVQDVSGPMKNIKTVFQEHKNELLPDIQATTDELEALRIAMEMEKDSIELYRKLLGDMNAQKERALFERLIEEEQQHFDIFSNTYSFLNDSGNWFMWEEHSIFDGGTPWA